MDVLYQAASVLMHLLHPPTRALNYVRQALVQRDLPTATARIDQARQKYPGRPDVNHLYATIHATQENWDQVRAGIEWIASCPDSSFDQLLDAAKLFSRIGEYDKAIELYRKLGIQSRSWNAGLTWNSIAQIHIQRSEHGQALHAFSECVCRDGPAPWVPIINVLQECGVESVARCRESMLKQPEQDRRSFRFHKFMSLMEQRLVDAGACDQQTVIQSQRTASKLSFEERYPDIQFDDNEPPLKPGFLIIGAMKCGTTSLFQMIEQHPRCLTSIDKEIQFFQFPHLNKQWYFEHFPRVSEDLGYVTGDASPGYYIFDIVDRVKELLPNIKLIFIQRDPARRAISHMRHNARFGMPDYGPDLAISGIDELEQEIESAPETAEQIVLDITYGKRKQNTFLALGCYELLIRRWKRAFGPDQLLSIELDDLSRRPQETMNRVFEFIGLESVPVVPVESNAGDYNEFDPRTEELLN